MPSGSPDRLADLKRSLDDRLPEGVRLGALALYLHTRRGLPLVDRIAERDGWDRYHDAGIATLLVLQVSVVALFVFAAWAALSGTVGATAANDPRNALAIPGLNEFMPLSAALYVAAGLVLATGIHELGHAIACRREDVAVEEWGVAMLFGILPIAAYVMPDEELDDAPARTRMRVFSVGIFNNVLLAVAALAVMLLPGVASPVEAYMAYFGWALTGGAPPTAATIAALGPVANLAFWTGFLSANVALLNALPVGILDGGKVLGLLARRVEDRLDLSPGATTAAVRIVGVCTVVLVVAAVFGPHLR